MLAWVCVLKVTHMLQSYSVYSSTSSQSGEVWNRLSVLPCPFLVLLPRIPRTICLPSTTWISPPKHWPCCHPFHTLHISHPLLILPTPPIIFLSVHHLRALGGKFCVIHSKSMLACPQSALWACQLCHPDGQIKNWFLRLLPCAGWIPLTCPLPFVFTLSLTPFPISHGHPIFSSVAFSQDHLCVW